MGILDKLRFFTPTTQSTDQVEQATPAFARTPKPLSQEDQTRGTQWRLSEPRPEHYDALFRHSQEVADAIKTIKQDTWRDGLTLEPDTNKTCPQCPFQTDEDLDACPDCDSPLEGADPAQKNSLEIFTQSKNALGQTLEDVGRELTEQGSVHGTAYAIHLKDYLINEDGRAERAELREVRAGDPRRLERVPEDDPVYVCLSCRSETNYSPLASPETCPTCGRSTYRAEYEETNRLDDGTVYYIDGEVHELYWHYEDGSSPLLRLWDKAVTLLWMDKVGLRAFDPRYERAPSKLLVTMGGDEQQMKRWIEFEQEQSSENPDRLGHLHMEAKEVPGVDKPTLDAQVFDLSDEFIKGQSKEIREEHQSSIWSEYGVQPLDQSSVPEGAGGLNNEGLQLRSKADTVTGIQDVFEDWLDQLVHDLGVTDWALRFPNPLPEDEEQDADTIRKKLEAAQKASELGLGVQWREGDIVIEDGDVEAPDPGPGPMGMPGGFSDDAPSDSTRVPGIEMAMPTNHGQAPDFVNEQFGGPSGAVLAQDVLLDTYEDLDNAAAADMQTAIVDVMNDPDGWGTKKLEQALKQVFTEHGLDNLAGRAKTIARTEAGAMVTEAKRRKWKQMDAAREEELAFRVVGANDHRTTKMSRWIRQQVPDEGLPLNELEEVLDEAVSLAKRGAFLEDGEHGDLPGDPIELPNGFRRRGFITHYNDRDEVVRAI